MLVDSSEEMLGIARKEAEASGVAERICFRHADAGQLQELFDAESFDIVVCHNLLEYVADPSAIVRGISYVLRKNAVVPVLLRNRAGEVLKAAIKSSDGELVKNNRSVEKVVDSLYAKSVRVFDSPGGLQLFSQARLGVVAEYGVRVFWDYLDSADPNDETYRQLLELELILEAHPQFAAIARYIQMIARHSSASPGEET